MPTIAILPEQGEDQPTTFSAVTAGRKATGRTVGEALDALTSQLSPEETRSPVIVQQFRPDQHFSAAQRDRLSTLIARRQAARENGDTLTAAEQSELENLVDEEIQGAGERAAHILRGLETTEPGQVKEELWAKLEVRESRNTLQLYILNLLAGILAVLLIAVSYIFWARSLLFTVTGILIASTVSNAILLLSHRRMEAARGRAGNLHLQGGDKIYDELMVIEESLEPPVDRSMYRERPKAR
jgi:hypothetical protein